MKYYLKLLEINFINQKNTPTNEDVVMQRLTGEWVIIDIGYKWTRGNFIQTVMDSDLERVHNRQC